MSKYKNIQAVERRIQFSEIQPIENRRHEISVEFYFNQNSA